MRSSNVILPDRWNARWRQLRFNKNQEIESYLRWWFHLNSYYVICMEMYEKECRGKKTKHEGQSKTSKWESKWKHANEIEFIQISHNLPKLIIVTNFHKSVLTSFSYLNIAFSWATANIRKYISAECCDWPIRISISESPVISLAIVLRKTKTDLFLFLQCVF